MLRRLCVSSVVGALVTLGLASHASGQVTVLHTFAGGAADGAFPGAGAPALLGPTLYGMTTAGGADDLGTVYKFGADGTGFSLLHSFQPAPNDGALPQG